jgi:hypothetical protein
MASPINTKIMPTTITAMRGMSEAPILVKAVPAGLPEDPGLVPPGPVALPEGCPVTWLLNQFSQPLAFDWPLEMVGVDGADEISDDNGGSASDETGA